jgi:tRNA G18 (ribose-2'-O)-methylase SpoU
MLSKTALGADKYVEWEGARNISTIINRLKKENVQIVALEQDEESVDYRKLKVGKNKKGVALIVGNEPKGVDKRILKKCDTIIEIPMCGQKKSLNVAVSVGVAGYEIKQK